MVFCTVRACILACASVRARTTVEIDARADPASLEHTQTRAAAQGTSAVLDAQLVFGERCEAARSRSAQNRERSEGWSYAPIGPLIGLDDPDARATSAKPEGDSAVFEKRRSPGCPTPAQPSGARAWQLNACHQAERNIDPQSAPRCPYESGSSTTCPVQKPARSALQDTEPALATSEATKTSAVTEPPSIVPHGATPPGREADRRGNDARVRAENRPSLRPQGPTRLSLLSV